MTEEYKKELTEAYTAPYDRMYKKVVRIAFKDGMNAAIKEFEEFFRMVAEMRYLENRAARLRYSQNIVERGEALEALSHIRSKVDNWLTEIQESL